MTALPSTRILSFSLTNNPNGATLPFTRAFPASIRHQLFCASTRLVQTKIYSIVFPQPKKLSSEIPRYPPDRPPPPLRCGRPPPRNGGREPPRRSREEPAGEEGVAWAIDQFTRVVFTGVFFESNVRSDECLLFAPDQQARWLCLKVQRGLCDNAVHVIFCVIRQIQS